MQILEEAIAEAQRYLEELSAPPNEANTCEWVIRPLLVSVGYANHELLAQSGDIAKKFPDYTILGGTEHTWYLEAKAWSVALESIHVDQALNYAHSNGRRWVVLTNGREWRLYDDHIKGVSADRLVATAMLGDSEGMAKFLIALSRDSIVSQTVGKFVDETRVAEFLSNALSNPSSPVIQAVLKVIRQHLGDVRVDPQFVLGHLKGLSAPVPAAPAPIPDRPTTPVQIENVYLGRHKGLSARVRLESDHWILLQGSQVSKSPVPSYAETYRKRTLPLVDNGDLRDAGTHYEVVRDISFRSPSGASDFVIGGASNGWEWWKDTSGRTIDELLRRK